METKSLRCGFVIVDAPATGRLFVRTFPLQEMAAEEYAVRVVDRMSTGACRVDCGEGIFSLKLIEATREGRMFANEAEILALDC